MSIRTRTALAMLGWAAASFSLSLVLLVPTDLQATGADQLSIAPEVSDPILVANGVELRVQRAQSDSNPRAGDSLSLILVAKNTSDSSMTIEPTVSMQSTPTPDRMSRVMPTPTQLWTQQPTITIAAGETKTIALEKTAQLPKDSSVVVTLQNGVQSAVMIRLAVPKA